jgi:hypothetical protein
MKIDTPKISLMTPVLEQHCLFVGVEIPAYGHDFALHVDYGLDEVTVMLLGQSL